MDRAKLMDTSDLSWCMVQAGPMSGPGVGLQLPQNLYPSELNNAPYDFPSNYVGLAAGDSLPIPRGDFIITLGSYCVLEYDDPLTPLGCWTIAASAAWDAGLLYVQSDGFNYRISNKTGCPVGGIVNAYGSGYVQATTSIAVVGGGGSTWAPIVGGQLTMTTATIVTANSGAGYGVAPIALIPAPPGPNNNVNGVGGIRASGFCTIASGTVSGFTFTDPGAGYPTGNYTIVCLPNPTDPNINTGITLATLTFSVTGSGSITGALCTQPGAPLSTPNNITLTLSGAGTNGTVSAIMCQTVVSTSIVGTSTLANGTVAALLTTVGGYPQSAGPATPITGTVTNGPQYLITGAVSIGGAGGQGLWARPRPLQAQLTIGATGTLAAGTGIIYDGGLFYGVPVPVISGVGAGIILGATGTVIGQSSIVLGMGSRPDFVLIQPLKN
jgi:hypothetical protein